jgi:hypothetical protein
VCVSGASGSRTKTDIPALVENLNNVVRDFISVLTE